MHRRIQLWAGLSGLGAVGLWITVGMQGRDEGGGGSAPTPPGDPLPLGPSEVRAGLEPAGRESVPPTPSGAALALGAIAGVVRDELGEPVEGAYVHARSSERHLQAPQAGTQTGTRGEFHLAGLHAGPLSVEASARDFASARLELPGAGAGELRAGLELVLRSGESLGGRVWLPDGQAAVDARLSIEDERSIYWRGGFAATWDDRCDAEGRFEVSGLSAGPFRVRAWLPCSETREERAMATLAGVVAGTSDLALHLGRPGSLELELAGGEAVPGCSLLVLDLDGSVTGGTPDAMFAEEHRPSWSARAGADGFRVESVEPGERLVLVRCPERSLVGWTRLLVISGTTARATIALMPAARLEPRLRGTAEASLRVQDDGAFALRVDGDLEREGVLLPAGAYRVRAECARGSAEAGVILVAGERRELPLVFE